MQPKTLGMNQWIEQATPIAFLRFYGDSGLGRIVDYVYAYAKQNAIDSDKESFFMKQLPIAVAQILDCAVRQLPITQSLGHIEVAVEKKRIVFLVRTKVKNDYNEDQLRDHCVVPSGILGTWQFDKKMGYLEWVAIFSEEIQTRWTWCDVDGLPTKDQEKRYLADNLNPSDDDRVVFHNRNSSDVDTVKVVKVADESAAAPENDVDFLSEYLNEKDEDKAQESEKNPIGPASVASVEEVELNEKVKDGTLKDERVFRVLRALETERERSKNLAERCIQSERDANQAHHKIQETKSRFDQAMRQLQTLKKDQEQTKVKIVQGEQEKNKLQNEIKKLQAQLQTIMKRQAS